MKYAVVDLGTNSARLMVAHIENGRAVSEYKTLRMIRLGEGMVEKKKITDGAMIRTRDTLIEYLNMCRQYNDLGGFYCFATSAVREAENKADLVDFIRKECGVVIDIISGEMEAMLGFSGCVTGFGGMFDIGGGSTEVMFGTLDNIEYRHSFKIGTVRLLQLFPGADFADPDSLLQAHKYAENVLKEIPDTGSVIFTGIGGSATALAAIDLELKEYSSEKVQGHIISYKRADDICRMLESKTKEERAKLIGLEEKRADVIVFGAVIMLEFMKKTGSDEIIVSDRDNQESYLEMKFNVS